MANTKPSTSSKPQQPSTSNTPAQAQAQAVATPAPVVGVRTLPNALLAALLGKGAALAHCANNPKRPGSKAALAWPTLAKCSTVAQAVATPGMAPHLAYGLAHGQCMATLPGPGGATVGNVAGQPLTPAQVASAKAALGLP